MERVFPWFSVKKSRFWEPNKVSNKWVTVPDERSDVSCVDWGWQEPGVSCLQTGGFWVILILETGSWNVFCASLEMTNVCVGCGLVLFPSHLHLSYRRRSVTLHVDSMCWNHVIDLSVQSVYLVQTAFPCFWFLICKLQFLFQQPMYLFVYFG